MRNVGTVVRGIRTPIIKKGDDLVNIVTNSLMNASKTENFKFNDYDIIAITEAVVAISENNYVHINDIAKEINKKIKSGHVGLVFPILSRNRFSIILKGIARSCSKITMLLSFPCDEVGNSNMDEDKLYKLGYNLGDTILEEEYNNKFKDYKHPFTGINMIEFYKQLVNDENCEINFIFTNNPKIILDYTNNIICCDIHSRKRTKNLLFSENYIVYDLTDILNEENNNHGYNPQYGLLGSNKSTEEILKLFPRTGEKIVLEVQKKMQALTNKEIEVMIYGDGAFKDPSGGIWELADPIVSSAFTKGLNGHPNEIKLKYIADNKFSNLKGDTLNEAIKKEIKNKNKNLTGCMESQGTTPRKITDLIGSLADLTSGSGDKGTPIVLIQNYFDSYADN
ncbi:MAG: coenzyme F420-0:L-glutamate ligase [Bacilli bacterium]|nr:coenzyme F420-0:L-glutamate ligase [Bacilli bacterium]MDD4406933.1 coenzyme F420-0:L-glutamate ligase [Bacilli bacterium]